MIKYAQIAATRVMDRSIRSCEQRFQINDQYKVLFGCQIKRMHSSQIDDLVKTQVINETRSINRNQESIGLPRLEVIQNTEFCNQEQAEHSIFEAIAKDDFEPSAYPELLQSKGFTFHLVCKIFERILETRGKDSKQAQKTLLSNFFRATIIYFPSSLLNTFYILSGQICPSYVQVEMGVGEGTIYKILSEITGLTKKDLKAKTDECGDLSILPIKTLKNEGSMILVDEIYEELRKLSTITGTGSVSEKEKIISSIFRKSSSIEVKYLIRLIQKSLKIGASETTVIDSLAWAVESTPPSQTFPHRSYENKQILAHVLDNTVKVCPDFSKIINELLKITPDCDLAHSLDSCKSAVGSPVQPMAAQPVKEIEELISRFEGKKMTCEYKYDGMRGQIHKEGNKVKIFSRGSENITSSYPDICLSIFSQLPASVQNCILDCEIIPINPLTSQPESFSLLQTRKRKHVELEDIQVPVSAIIFDLLLLNNESLLSKSLSDRRLLLQSLLKPASQDNQNPSESQLQLVEFKDISDIAEIHDFLLSAVGKGCEGLMIKSLESSYEAGTRSFSWLKLKKDYIGEGFNQTLLPDSLDLTPVGGYHGTGKRKGLFGSFLLASYDQNRQEYQTVCKLGTGFSDLMLKKFTEKLKLLQVKENDEQVKTVMQADVWFKPELVWEVQAADLSLSPVHTSAWDQVGSGKGKGISIRFPRFVRERDDKNKLQVTKSEDILKYFLQQKGRNQGL